MKTLLKFTALIGASAALAAHAADPALAVAGRSTTLEQAVAAPHANSYRLLVRRDELGRVTASRAGPEARELLERARRDGAVVFVCEKDLRAAHLHRSDLLPGVVAIDGSDVWENGEPKSADRKLRRFCS